MSVTKVSENLNTEVTAKKVEDVKDNDAAESIKSGDLKAQEANLNEEIESQAKLDENQSEKDQSQLQVAQKDHTKSRHETTIGSIS